MVRFSPLNVIHVFTGKFTYLFVSLDNFTLILFIFYASMLTCVSLAVFAANVCKMI